MNNNKNSCFQYKQSKTSKHCSLFVIRKCLHNLCFNMEPALNQGHSTFRNQPSYTIFNKSFEDPNDILFLQLNEIDPYFLTEEQLQNKDGFLRNKVIDPRTKKEQKWLHYNYIDNNKNCFLFKGGGIKSSLTKFQQDICLRVLFGWQEKTEIDEADLLQWRKLEVKIKKEREHMHKFIREYADKHKEDLYAPTKRLNECYRRWFKRKANMLLQKHKENLTFNTHTGLPHVSVCKNINNELADISDVQLLGRKGWIRVLAAEHNEINWRNLNFRLDEHVDTFNEALHETEENLFEKKLRAELNDFEDQENGRSCYMPFETILFLLTAGFYVDMPTECLLEIGVGTTENDKTIKFDCPFPARNCGWHTQQMVYQQALDIFHSKNGRSKWLYVENETVEAEILETAEIHAVNKNSSSFQPLSFERYLENYQTKAAQINNQLKSNTALIKWYLKSPESVESLKILSTLSLPATLDDRAKKFLAHETLKLENKPQFGCELLTKYELLRVWLKVRLMGFAETTDFGYCYRISNIDGDIQLKERLTLSVVEEYLNHTYHINPAQLISNLAEFLKLIYNMPTGKYLLRYNPKYQDKFLLCAPSQEVTLNTIHLHSLFQAEPTDMCFMTQPQFLPIIETLCSCLHLKYRILPCAFLPKMPYQTNLQTIATKVRTEEMAAERREAAKQRALKVQKSKAELDEIKRQKHKRWRQKKKKKVAQNNLKKEETENKNLFEF